MKKICIYSKFIKILAIFLLPMVLLGVMQIQDKTEQLEQFEDFAKRAMAIYHIPGCSIAAIENGKISYTKGFGYRDIEHKLPVTPETIFAIGSCTKAFTATALGILVDQGKLDWDKPIKKYLPGFAMYDNKATEQLSILDCLCHRSGLPRYDCLWNRFKNRAELIENLKYLKPSAEFREKWQYNNLMYVLAGYVLENISGIAWDIFIQENITKPLDMNNTYFSASVVPTHPNASLAYEFDQKAQTFKQVNYNNLDIIAPAGSIHSSALDMAKWVIANLQNKNINEEIHKPQIKMGSEQDDLKYCLGWCKTPKGDIVHDGGTTGCSALVGFIPKEQVGFVVLSNIEDEETEFDELLAKYLHAYMTNDDKIIKELEDTLSKKEAFDKKTSIINSNEKINSITPTQAAKFAGIFHNNIFGDLIIKTNDSQIQGTFLNYTENLTYLDENTLKSVDAESEFHFKRDSFGNFNQFEIEIEKGCSYLFTKI